MCFFPHIDVGHLSLKACGMVVELLTVLLSQPHISCIDERLPAPPAHLFDAELELRSVPFGKNLNVSLPKDMHGQRDAKDSSSSTSAISI